MFLPEDPQERASGAIGPLPSLWCGQEDPDVAREPWKSAAIGSEYTYGATVWIKTHNSGSASDWKKFNLKSYVVNDLFLTNVSAGALNGTAADPKGGTRSATDTDSDMSITGGVVDFRAATADYGDPRINYATVSRTAGLLFGAEVNVLTLSGLILDYGLDNGSSGNVQDSITYNSVSNLNVRDNNTIVTVAPAPSAGQSTHGVLVSRAGGGFMALFRARPTAPYKLVWLSEASSYATLTPALSNYSAEYASGQVFVSDDYWMPTPLASDGFASSFGATDGLGHPETSGVGAGGSGATWTTQAGTWAISSGEASPSSATAFATIAGVDTDDVYVMADLTRSAGEVGLVLRYTDANNYLIAYIDGTNAKLDEVVSGTPNTLITGAVTYGAGNELRLSTDGQRAIMHYNKLYVGDTSSIDSALTANNHGIYSDNTGNSIDNFVMYAKGTDDEYRVLGEYFAGNVKGLFAIGDSKTNNAVWVTELIHNLNRRDVRLSEVDSRFGFGGFTASLMKTHVDNNLSAVTGEAHIATINLGANDVTSLPAEATWKGDIQSIIDSLKAKWPSIRVYIAKPWRQSYNSQCATLATWIDDLVAANEKVHVGPDENIWLENGDDGATYTTDGTHYTTAAESVAATQWDNVITWPQ